MANLGSKDNIAGSFAGDTTIILQDPRLVRRKVKNSEYNYKVISIGLSGLGARVVYILYYTILCYTIL